MMGAFGMADGSTSRTEGGACLRARLALRHARQAGVVGRSVGSSGGFYEHDEGVPRDRMSSLR